MPNTWGWRYRAGRDRLSAHSCQPLRYGYYIFIGCNFGIPQAMSTWKQGGSCSDLLPSAFFHHRTLHSTRHSSEKDILLVKSWNPSIVK